MKYQLANGKTINISFEKWLDLTDNDIQELLAKDSGRFVEDPFSDDVLPFYDVKMKNNEIEEIPLEKLPPEDKELLNGEV